MMPGWIRYPCMAFGLLNMVQAIRYSGGADLFMAVGGTLVGGAWFAFGWYGGLPLVETVSDWRPPATPGEITDMHRRGLLTMRRRRWISWAAVPISLGMAALLIPWLDRIGQTPLAILVIGVPWVVVNGRYWLSRCPRCGYGFFARGMGRAAFLGRGKTCRHCGLGLDAYKERRPA